MLPLVLWPLGISAVLLALNWPLSRLLPRLGEPLDGVKDASPDAYHAMFGITHHDIWWAKEHAWTIITYLVGVVVTLVVVDMKELTLAERDALGVLYTATALLAILYAGRMQSDMAVARIRSSFLVHHTPSLGAVVERLVGTDRDYYRGSAFMLALALLCAGASSIAVAVLKKETELGWYSYGFLGICSLASLHGQVAYRALKARKGLFAKPLKN